MFLPNFEFTSFFYGFLNFDFSPRHTVHCLQGTVVCLLHLLLVSSIHCYRKKNILDRHAPLIIVTKRDKT